MSTIFTATARLYSSPLADGEAVDPEPRRRRGRVARAEDNHLKRVERVGEPAVRALDAVRGRGRVVVDGVDLDAVHVDVGPPLVGTRHRRPDDPRPAEAELDGRVDEVARGKRAARRPGRE